MLPRKRTTDLHIEEVNGETVVYDQRTNAAHCLNPVAQAVWNEIDAHPSVESLTRSVTEHVHTEIDAAIVEGAIEALLASGLLEPTATPSKQGMTRRDAAKAALTASVALAFVTTVTAPTAAQTQSGGQPIP